MPDDFNDYVEDTPRPKLRKVVRGGDKLTGVQPDLLDHWNALRDEFDTAGITPEIRSGYRTTAQQQALYNNPATRARTKGNDGITNISPHQEGRALDVHFNAAQRDAGHRIMAAYAHRSGLHIPADEPWHIALPKAVQQQQRAQPTAAPTTDDFNSYIEDAPDLAAYTEAAPSKPKSTTKLSTADTAWHYGMTAAEARNLSPKAYEILQAAVDEDTRKRAAGQTIGQPNVAYQNEMRARAGLKPLRQLSMGEFKRADERAVQLAGYDQPVTGNVPNLQAMVTTAREHTPDIPINREEIRQRILAEHAAVAQGSMGGAEYEIARAAAEQPGELEAEITRRATETQDQAAFEATHGARIADLTAQIRTEIQRQGGAAVDRTGHGSDRYKWLQETGTKAGAGLLEVVGGFVRGVGRAATAGGPNAGGEFAQGGEDVADNLRVISEAARRAAEAEGADRNAASKWAQDVVVGAAASLPAIVAMSAGLPGWAAFGGQSGLEALGRDEHAGDIAAATAHGAATGAAFELGGGPGGRLARTARKMAGVGAGTSAVDVAFGASPSEALRSGATNALLAGASELMHGKPVDAAEVGAGVEQILKTPEPRTDAATAIDASLRTAGYPIVGEEAVTPAETVTAPRPTSTTSLAAAMAERASTIPDDLAPYTEFVPTSPEPVRTRQSNAPGTERRAEPVRTLDQDIAYASRIAEQHGGSITQLPNGQYRVEFPDRTEDVNAEQVVDTVRPVVNAAHELPSIPASRGRSGEAGSVPIGDIADVLDDLRKQFPDKTDIELRTVLERHPSVLDPQDRELRARALSAPPTSEAMARVQETAAESLHQQIERARQQQPAKLAPEQSGTITGRLDINRDRMIDLVGPAMYEKPIAEVTVKELLQNALDTSRSSGATNAKPKRIDIDYDQNARTIVVRDSGAGMTPEIIQEAFFTIGGTHKEGRPEDTSGGLGLAKMAFILGSKSLRLETVRDGKLYTVDTNAGEIRNGTYDIKVSSTNAPNGTKVTVEIPRTFKDANGENQNIYFYEKPDFLDQPLLGPVEVALNGEVLDRGVHTKNLQRENKFNFSWGHMDVYIDPARTDNPRVDVLSAGLHQFNEFIYSPGGKFPHNLVLDVRPKVRPENPAYPFNNQREGWRGTVKEDIKAMKEFIAGMALEASLADTKDVFSAFEKLPKVDPASNLSETELLALSGKRTTAQKPITRIDRIIDVDFSKPAEVAFRYESGEIHKVDRQEYVSRSFRAEKELNFSNLGLDMSAIDPRSPLMHNNTTADVGAIPGAHKLFTELGNALIGFMREWGNKVDEKDYAELATEDPTGWFGGISLGKAEGYGLGYRGLNMEVPMKAIWLNPSALSNEALQSPAAAAAETLHIFIHEITHVKQRSEDASFTAELATNYARIASKGVNVAKFERILENIYEHSWSALNNVVDTIGDFNTKNRSKRFKDSVAVSEGRPGAAEPAADRPSEFDLPGTERVRAPGPTGAERTAEADRSAGRTGDIVAGEPVQSGERRIEHPHDARLSGEHAGTSPSGKTTYVRTESGEIRAPRTSTLANPAIDTEAEGIAEVLRTNPEMARHIPPEMLDRVRALEAREAAVDPHSKLRDFQEQLAVIHEHPARVGNLNLVPDAAMRDYMRRLRRVVKDWTPENAYMVDRAEDALAAGNNPSFVQYSEGALTEAHAKFLRETANVGYGDPLRNDRWSEVKKEMVRRAQRTGPLSGGGSSFYDVNKYPEGGRPDHAKIAYILEPAIAMLREDARRLIAEGKLAAADFIAHVREQAAKLIGGPEFTDWHPLNRSAALGAMVGQLRKEGPPLGARTEPRRAPATLPKSLAASERVSGTEEMADYEEAPNKRTMERVTNRMNTEGPVELERWYHDAPPSPERTEAHRQLVDHYTEEAVRLDTAGDTEGALAAHQRAVDISNTEIDRSHNLGQTVQAYSMIGRFSPTAVFRDINALARKGAEIKPEQVRELTAAAAEHERIDKQVKALEADLRELQPVGQEVGGGGGRGTGGGTEGGTGAGTGPGAEGEGGGGKRRKPRVPRAPRTEPATTAEVTAKQAALLEARARRAAQKQFIAQRMRALEQSRTVRGYYLRSMNITRALMVSALSTAMRNLQSQVVRYNVERLTDTVEHAIRRTVGLQSDFTQRSIWSSAARQFQRNEAAARTILSEHPDQLAKMFNRYAGTGNMADLPVPTGVAHGIERMFQSMERATELVNTFNTLQEFHLRAAEFLSELDLHVRREEGISLDAFVRRHGADAIPRDTIKAAVNKALEVTFAASPGNEGPGGQFLNAAIRIANYIPPTISPAPFAKFMFNNLKFLYQYNPVGGLLDSGIIAARNKGIRAEVDRIRASDILTNAQKAAAVTKAEKNLGNIPRALSRTLIGTGMLLTAYAARKEFGGEKWYELKLGKHTVDTRPFGPFSTYLFLAEAVRRKMNGEKGVTVQEIGEALGSSTQPGGTASAVAQKLYDYIDSGDWQRVQRVLKTEAGDFGRALLTPIRQLKDLIAAFDASEGYARDTSEAPFTGAIRESIPFASRGLPVVTRPTSSTPIHQEHPGIKAVTGWRVETPKTFLESQLDELHFAPTEIRPSTGIPRIDALEKRLMAPMMDDLSRELQGDKEFQSAPKAVRAKMIKDAIEDIRNDVRQMGAEEEPDLYEQLKEERKPRREREYEKAIESSPGLSRALQLGVPVPVPQRDSSEDDLAYRARLLQTGRAQRAKLDAAMPPNFDALDRGAQRKLLHAAIS